MQAVKIYSKDRGGEFGIEKCGICKWKTANDTLTMVWN